MEKVLTAHKVKKWKKEEAGTKKVGADHPKHFFYGTKCVKIIMKKVKLGFSLQTYACFIKFF